MKADKTNIVCSPELCNWADSFRQKSSHNFHFSAPQRKRVKGVGGDYSRGQEKEEEGGQEDT